MSDLGPIEGHHDAVNLAIPLRTYGDIHGTKRSSGAFLWVVAVAVISGVGASALLINQHKSASDQQIAAAENQGRADAMSNLALAGQQNAPAAQQAATQMSMLAQQSPTRRADQDRTAPKAAVDRSAASAEQSGQDASATVPASGAPAPSRPIL